jgi:hypothetical protein
LKNENQSLHVRNINKLEEEDQSMSFNIKKPNLEN